MAQNEIGRTTAKKLDLIFTETSEVAVYRSLLQSFPYNVQQYVDQIGKVEWKTQSTAIRMDQASISTLKEVSDTVDYHCIFLLKDSKVDLEHIARQPAIRQHVLKRYSKSTEDLVLVIVSQVPIPRQIIDKFLNEYPQTLILYCDSQTTDHERGYEQQAWKFCGFMEGSLAIERNDKERVRARFLTKRFKLDMVLEKDGRLIGYESSIINPEDQACTYWPMDNELAKLDSYSSPFCEGRVDTFGKRIDFGHLHSSQQEGTFIEQQLIMGTTIEHEHELELRRTTLTGSYKDQECIIEKICSGVLYDRQVKIETVNLLQGVMMGKVQDGTNKRVEGYIDESFGPKLALSQEGSNVSMQPYFLAKLIPKHRTIWSLQVGHFSVSQLEHTFLNSVVELCDTVGFPFPKEIEYQHHIRQCALPEAKHLLGELMSNSQQHDVCHLQISEGPADCLDWLTQFVTKKFNQNRILIVSDMRTNYKQESHNQTQEASRAFDLETFFITRGSTANNLTVSTDFLEFPIALAPLCSRRTLVTIDKRVEAILLDGKVASFGFVSDIGRK